MPLNRNIAAALTGLLAWSNVAVALPAAPKRETPSHALTSHERALQAVSRLTFGARPGEVSQVEAMGVDKWIEEQLHPEKIPDTEMAALLSDLPAMRRTEAQLFEKFPPTAYFRIHERQGSESLPTDPVEHAIYASQFAYIQQRLENKQTKTQNAAATNGAAAEPLVTRSYAMEPKSEMVPGVAAGASVAANPANAQQTDLSPEEKLQIKGEQQRILALPDAQARFQAVLALAPGQPRKVLQRLRPQERQALVEGMTPEQREAVTALASTERLVSGEMMAQKLLYDVYSRRELLEVMTDFWLNHFNVYDRKNDYAPWAIATYERDVIRPHALGKFDDLLVAVAESPAMMEYLDNAQSIGPDSPAVARAKDRVATQARAGQPAPMAKKIADRGLNENYARELMELHTLGVDGGYTQHDVTEVAKIFTGWTVDKPQQGGEFTFDPRRHEPGTKVVMGKTFADNGQQEGLQLLHMLAMKPATARHLSYQLAVKFVSDDPPPALVNRMAASYLKSKGDVRVVLRTMFTSPEFWSRDAFRAKVKTPLEFVVSSVRATDTDASHPGALVLALNQLGMPLYGDQPPTGYSNDNTPWVSSSALISRMNFALALASNKLPQLTCDAASLTPNGGTEGNPQLEAQLEQTFLNGEASERTRATVLKEMDNLPGQEQAASEAAKQFTQAPAGATASMHGAPDPLGVPNLRKNGQPKPVALTRAAPAAAGQVTEATVAAGLLLGSPEFQRR